jgi:hypothetical protein
MGVPGSIPGVSAGQGLGWKYLEIGAEVLEYGREEGPSENGNKDSGGATGKEEEEGWQVTPAEPEPELLRGDKMKVVICIYFFRDYYLQNTAQKVYIWTCREDAFGCVSSGTRRGCNGSNSLVR